MFRKKNTWVKPVAWIAALAVLIVVGYFLASYVMGDGSAETSAPSSKPSGDTSQEVSAQPPTTRPPTTEEIPLVDINEPVRAVYVPVSVLMDKSRNGLMDWLEKLAADGHNSVVVQLKDYTGNVYYQSAAPQAATAKAVVESAVSLEDLTTIREQMEVQGFRLIPLLSAFYDATAPRRLTAARIPYGPDPSQNWLDDAPSAGGKPWLNPYADEAHEYILGYITELRGAGFATQLLDGVQFPFQTYLAGFDTTVHKGKSKAEMLKLFVSRAKTALGENGHLMLSATGLSVTSINMGIYGDNPLDFGADTVVAQMYVDTLGNKQTFAGTAVDIVKDPVTAVVLAVRQVVTRPGTQSQSTIGVQVKDFTEEQLNELLNAVKTEMGDAASYILYHTDGVYS